MEIVLNIMLMGSELNTTMPEHDVWFEQDLYHTLRQYDAAVMEGADADNSHIAHTLVLARQHPPHNLARLERRLADQALPRAERAVPLAHT